MSENMALNILDSKGTQKGELKLDPEIYGKGVREAVVYDAVRYQLLKKRAGTHSTLTKSTMKGGGKKPWKQKGTGRARSGSNTSPVWVGGAVAHGPKPRDYTNRTMRRSRTKALAGVIREKAKDGSLFCFEEIATTRSAEFSAMLKGIKVLGKKVLFVAGSDIAANANGEFKNSKAVKSARNIEGVSIIAAEALNTYDVLNSDALVLTKATFDQVSQSLKDRAKKN